MRTRKTFPATSCASRLSFRSANKDLMRATMRASADDGADFTFSESIRATGSLRAGYGRDANDGKAIASA